MSWLLLVVLPVLALAGAAPVAGWRWQQAGVLPAPGGDLLYEVAGDRLYVSAAVADGRVTSGYAVDPLRRLWSVRTAATVNRAAQLQSAGPVLLLQVGQSTTVLNARTGKVRWASPSPVQVPSGGHTALVQAEQFRPGTEYDQSSGEPGLLYFSSAGVPHTEPPTRTEVRGVDLGTGAPRWSVRAAGSAFAAPGGGGPAAPGGAASAGTVLAVTATRLELRAADTGALLRERALPPAGGAAWPDIVGDLVLLRYGGDTGDRVLAYALDTLEPRWQRTFPAGTGDTRVCLGVPCEQRGDALVVLDPVTGAARWRTDNPVNVLARGSDALEVAAAGDDPVPVRLVDLSTGAAGVDLRSWQAYARGPAGSPLILARTQARAGTTFGVLVPGLRQVRPLGRSATALSDCRSDDRLVACLGAGGLEVWSYRS